MLSKIFRSFVLLTFLTCSFSFAQKIPTPREHFGFNIGDDYKLATYTQSESYYLKVAAASNRVKVVEIGLTEEGRKQYMLIVYDADVPFCRGKIIFRQRHNKF